MSVQSSKLSTETSPEFLSVSTLALWLSCSVIGITGLALPYSRPHAPAKEPEPVQAEVLKVELTADPLPPEAQPPPLNVVQPPPMLQPTAAQQAPPMLAVAEPSPSIAFALPVNAPARVVDVREASYTRPTEEKTTAVTTSAPTPQPLTFGQGEGKQPAPEYPPQAMRDGQEGVVTVRFSVGENGRVTEATASSPSPWPLLNRAAVRVVRERWRFPSGALRLYEVSIRFQIKK